jgi:fatty acid amide hydrolase 2
MTSEKNEPFVVTIRENLSPLSPVYVLWELVKSVLGLSVHTTPALLLAAVEELPTRYFPGLTAEMRELGDRLKERLHARLKDDCVLVLPTLPTPAPMHGALQLLHFKLCLCRGSLSSRNCTVGESILRIFDTANTSFFNVMELPSTAVPLGLSSKGVVLLVSVNSFSFHIHISLE